MKKLMQKSNVIKQRQLPQTRTLAILGIVIMFGSVGSFLITKSFAATSTIAIEAEQGTVAGNSIKRTGQVGASATSAVEFGTGGGGGGNNLGGKVDPATAATTPSASNRNKLIFSDEFAGATLDYTKWQTCNPSLQANCVPHNNEAQCFDSAQAGNNPNYNPHPGNNTNDHVKVSGGQAHLIATKGGPICPNGNDAYGNKQLGIWSGMIGTGPLNFGMQQPGYTDFSYTHGFFEARVKFPIGKGLWPSLWMLPKEFGCWPKGGEYDVIEHGKHDNDQGFFTVHTGNQCGGNSDYNGTDNVNMVASDNGFRTYAFEWTADYLKWYVNGKVVKEVYDKKYIKNTPFFINANFSFAGHWTDNKNIGANTFPISMDVDWVRIWQ